MAIQQIVGAVINSEHITTDRAEINAARLTREQIEYITRDRARLVAHQTRSPDWGDLVRGKTLFVVVDGQRFEPSRIDGQDAPVRSPLATSRGLFGDEEMGALVGASPV